VGQYGPIYDVNIAQAYGHALPIKLGPFYIKRSKEIGKVIFFWIYHMNVFINNLFGLTFGNVNKIRTLNLLSRGVLRDNSYCH